MHHQSTPVLFDRFFGGAERPLAAHTGARTAQPAIDLVEASDHYEVIADLPGVTREQVKVEFEDGVLTLKGERPEADVADEDARWFRRERRSGAFARAIVFREEVEVAAIEANVKDGVLRVRIPKAERHQPRQVPVTVN
jgi:HSP20 family protein